MRIVDLFAGMGGWSEGLRLLGLSDVGLELDATACATREAAGHETIRADVAAYPAERFAGYDGLIASPPCTDWSQAGNRLQRGGRTGDLVDQVPRWVEAVRPRWVACEQVPPALGVWQDFARLFASWGYSTWAGLLTAERYGVPQTRERAVLLARLDGVAHPPTPTHQRYEAGVAQGAADECQPSLLGPGVLPWVSMADALGWPDDLSIHAERGSGMTDRYGERPGRQATEPGFTVTAGTARSGPRWVIETHHNSRIGGGRVERFSRDCSVPAPTLVTPSASWRLRRGGGAGNGRGMREPMPATRPAPTVMFGHDAASWCWQRPATTVCADPRLGSPGHRDREGGERQFAADSVRLTVEEALVLQSFRPDYPVQGTKTKRFEQVGNAVPPLLARAVIGALLS